MTIYTVVKHVQITNDAENLKSCSHERISTDISIVFLFTDGP